MILFYFGGCVAATLLWVWAGAMWWCEIIDTVDSNRVNKTDRSSAKWFLVYVVFGWVLVFVWPLLLVVALLVFVFGPAVSLAFGKDKN